ncbi:MAG: hypothetical protein Q9227_006283 [Pyrenula ochraceoflavens]
MEREPIPGIPGYTRETQDLGKRETQNGELGEEKSPVYLPGDRKKDNEKSVNMGVDEKSPVYLPGDRKKDNEKSVDTEVDEKSPVYLPGDRKKDNEKSVDTENNEKSPVYLPGDRKKDNEKSMLSSRSPGEGGNTWLVLTPPAKESIETTEEKGKHGDGMGDSQPQEKSGDPCEAGAWWLMHHKRSCF